MTVWSTGVRGVLAAAALAGGLGACAVTGEPAQTAAVEPVEVDLDGLSQTVVPAGDGFSQVTVTTATFGEDDGVDGVLQLEVTGAGTERRTAAAGADLADNAPVTLSFAPVTGSAGERFTLTFTYAGTEPLALYANPHDPYPDGHLLGGAGDLVFVLGHDDRLAGAVDALARLAGEAARTAAGDRAFLAVWALSLAAATAVTLRFRPRR